MKYDNVYLNFNLESRRISILICGLYFTALRVAITDLLTCLTFRFKYLVVCHWGIGRWIKPGVAIRCSCMKW